MATGIAFVICGLALLGSRVPHSLRMLLLSLAIVDDIGAILVIAVGYTAALDGSDLLLAALGIAIVHLFSRIGVRNFTPYIVVGSVAWLALHESGVHATLAGVVLGLMTPAKSALAPERFREYLHEKKEAFQNKRWALRRQRTAAVQEVQRLTRETISPLEYFCLL